MTPFTYQNGTLQAEQVSCTELAAQHGTPLYVYSRAAITQQYQNLDAAFGAHPHRICYAVKANSNIAVLGVLAQLGAGFDIVSEGELQRVLAAGGDAAKTVFSGVGKHRAELVFALQEGIGCINVESESELALLNEVAMELGLQAPVSLRVNPDVDAQTHPYISTGLKENKFGIDIERAVTVYQQAADMAGIRIVGVDCHIGSQLTTITPFVDALDRVLCLLDQLSEHGITVQHIDIGGGVGICYDDETPPDVTDYAQQVIAKLNGRGTEIWMEPGRYMVGNAGLLLTTVEHLKPTEHKNFAIVDAAMNDLLRPALYQGWHRVLPVQAARDTAHDVAVHTWDIVGPICETGDFLAKDRDLALAQGDTLALMSAGAYGFVMSSNYNTRPRAAEIMVDGDQAHVVRRRETVADLLALETVLGAS